ncbi:MAG: bifunctional DNA-formamidopyrimidine glycosylase/DNA-(apurinic or apyrimidinic site) lyase [Chloroflexota bacterium]
MPELPEVETIARELDPLVRGARVVGFRTDWPRAVRHPDPATLGARIAGRTIDDVSRRAKWILLALSGDAVLAIQVKMTGQLFVLPADAPADVHVHHVLPLADGRELRIRDVRKFARLALYDRDAAGVVRGPDGTDPLDAFGPEPLADEFTLARFRALVRARRSRLKPLLLDQGFLAGVGNIYADEALWRARLHPLRRADAIGPAAERALHREIRAVLAEGIERRGSSIDDYTAPGGDGEMQEHLAVYQRTGQPCGRCGRPIRRSVLGIRSTHFCSWCQRLPATERSSATTAILRAGRAHVARRGPRWSELPVGDGAVGARPARRTRGAGPAAGEGTR